MTAATQIEAGPETDRLVAEALGFPHGIDDLDPTHPLTNTTAIAYIGDQWVPFRPSTRWNDAMIAAERFGLFKDRRPPGCCLMTGLYQTGDDGWEILEREVHDTYPKSIATAEAGPLAICRAILALKERTCSG